MLAFHWEPIDPNSKKIQTILQTIILAPLIFTKRFGKCGKKEGNNIIHYMLAYTILMEVP